MDFQAKRQLIEKIDDEVKELHPLLREVLKKLPGVVDVEYTHGVNEMGADFVVQRRDEALDVTSYIGVVVKADKIKQDFTDVERQISECAIPRLIKGGTEKVRLPEVWVVTSKGISQNAKEKIHETFAQRSVKFFDGEWLTGAVDKYAPFFWNQLKSSIGIYLSAFDKRVSEISSQSSLATSGASLKVFIDLDIEEIPSDRYTKNGAKGKTRIVNFWEEATRNQITYLEASMGFGKSHVARQTAIKMAEAGFYKTNKIVPVFATFKQFLDSANHDGMGFIRGLLGEACHADCVADGASFLLILDGLDEASSDDELCRKCLNTLIETARQNTQMRLLLTSRPLKMLEHLEVFNHNAKRYRIRPVSVAKILVYLRSILAQQSLPNKLVDSISKSHLFKQLPQNPIAASLLANIISQKSYELPSNLTELYAKTMDLMLGRWDERRAISTEKQFKATERLARHLARHMIDNQLIYMAKSEVREMFKAFLDERNIGVPLDEAYDYLVNRSNLLGTYEDTQVLFFRHRSFAEYLYAKNSYESRDLAIDSRAFHPFWANIYFFYLGTLLECPAAIGDLAGLQTKTETERWMQLFNMGNYMLAAYQTPYGVVEKTLEIVLIDAAKLFVDVRNGKFKSNLSDLSEMTLLWFIAQTVKQFYGYEFFKKALPLCVASIDESVLIDEETKLFAIFFASCALAECDDNCGYAFLMEKRKTSELPLVLSFGIKCEVEMGEKSFANSSMAKRHSKQLKKLLSTDAAGAHAQQAKLDSLFKKPISARAEKPVAALAISSKNGSHSKA